MLAGGARAAAARPDLHIHPQDSSLRYLAQLHHGALESARVSYFRSGWSGMRVIDQVLDWRFGAQRDRARVLDFASGYGRVTRFLVLRHPVERICTADILTDAVAFQSDRFGVRGFQSSARPRELAVAEEFDLIVAYSLFSHLPRESFAAWLRWLWEHLSPGGVLVFSTLGEGTLLPGRTMSADGFCFDAWSHLPELASTGYGSTWVREDFVEACLAPLLGPDDGRLRLPRALWAQQDLHLVARGAAEALGSFSFRWEPMGVLEELVTDGESLRLGGWAWDLAGEDVACIEVHLEDRLVAQVAPTASRPDVARHLAAPEDARTGWSAGVAAAQVDARDRLLVKIRARSDETYLAHLATVEATLLELELGRLHRELAALRRDAERERKARVALGFEVRRVQGELRRIEQALALSRFWKARNLWWKLRG